MRFQKSQNSDIAPCNHETQLILKFPRQFTTISVNVMRLGLDNHRGKLPHTAKLPHINMLEFTSLYGIKIQQWIIMKLVKIFS